MENSPKKEIFRQQSLVGSGCCGAKIKNGVQLSLSTLRICELTTRNDKWIGDSDEGRNDR
jgi:hypothetical protein